MPVIMEMAKRIELEKRGRKTSEVKELNLDSCRSKLQQIDGLTEDYTGLEILSINSAGLTTLKGFPKLPNLRKLEINDNRISTGLENLNGCPNLTHLSLSGNKIKSFDALEALKELGNLQSLDLFNCEVTNEEGYREKTFELLPSLKYLDGYDQDDQEAEDEVDDEDDEEDAEDEEDFDDEDDDEEGAKFNEDGEEDDDDEDDDEDPEGFDEDVDDDDLEDEEDEDEEEESNLGLLQQPTDLQDEDDDEDYEGVEDEEVEDEEDLNEDGEEDSEARGTKRKHEDEQEES